VHNPWKNAIHQRKSDATKPFWPTLHQSRGLDSTARFLELVDLRPEFCVLDAGCGIGGSAFYMARSFGCQVHGIDLSAEMIRVARERVKEEGLETKVQFYEGDCLTFKYPRHDYNLVYSREVFLHVVDKRSVFVSLRKNLAPAGRLLFTDYIRGPATPSEEFRAYIDKYGYSLEDLDSYRGLLIESGFAVMRAEDLTEMFLEILKRELEGLSRSSLDPQDILYLEERWKQKLLRAERGRTRLGALSRATGRMSRLSCRGDGHLLCEALSGPWQKAYRSPFRETQASCRGVEGMRRLTSWSLSADPLQDFLVEATIGGQGGATGCGVLTQDVGEPASSLLDQNLEGREVPETRLWFDHGIAAAAQTTPGTMWNRQTIDTSTWSASDPGLASPMADVPALPAIQS